MNEINAHNGNYNLFFQASVVIVDRLNKFITNLNWLNNIFSMIQ